MRDRLSLHTGQGAKHNLSANVRWCTTQDLHKIAPAPSISIISMLKLLLLHTQNTKVHSLSGADYKLFYCLCLECQKQMKESPQTPNRAETSKLMFITFFTISQGMTANASMCFI